jgi:hypothetical protein
MWLLLKGVLLTKDNILKKTSEGIIIVVFVTIRNLQHLFFDRHVAKFVRRIFTMAFGLQHPKSIVEFWSAAQSNRPTNTFSNLYGSKCNFLFYIWLLINEVAFD